MRQGQCQSGFFTASAASVIKVALDVASGEAVFLLAVDQLFSFAGKNQALRVEAVPGAALLVCSS